jgi:[protein-PII] uridylyltransferase
MAIGGYGRGELAPFSDVDIMLFALDRTPSERAQDILYRLWDTNLDISHSFRTPADCVNEARKDIRTRTSLLEHRYIAGDRRLYTHFKDTVYPEIAFRNQKSFITEKFKEVEARKKKFGDSVFMLEPNVKEGRGGLRDVHTILWLASVAFRMKGMDALGATVPPHDLHRLSKAYDFLLKVRFCLHLLSGRKNDALSLELHEAVAEMLNFKASRRFFASERFMRYFYLKTAIIHEVSSHALDMCALPYVQLPSFFMKRSITENFALSKDRIISLHEIGKNTDMIMEAFYAMSKTGKRFSPRLKSEIKKNLFRITKKARNSPGAIEWFMKIIRSGMVYETLREMHRCGVLGRFIPEFGALSFLVVYEPYHRYTVDEHSLYAVKRLEDLASTKYKSLDPLAEVFRRIRHKETLILSLLLHDIGKKGITREKRFPDRDAPHTFHEEEGYMEMKNVMGRFNLEVSLRGRIEFLVRNHTLMSSVALKKETDDPEVIAQFADEVVDRENLDALYLLTYADMASVSPDFWTEWRSYLVRELYESTARYIEGVSRKGMEHMENLLSLSEKEKTEVTRFLSLMPERYMLSTPPEKVYADYRLSVDVEKRSFAMKVSGATGGSAEITVGTWDSPGLFSRIVGALSSMGMSIYRARVYTGKNGLVMDKVQVSNWKELWWDGIEHRLEERLAKAVMNAHPGLVGREGGVPLEYVKAPELHGRFAPFIELDNETSAEYSSLEFFARDRHGLLYDVTSLIHEKDIDIISARINTESGIANDIFFLQQRGKKLQGMTIHELLLPLWERLQ